MKYLITISLFLVSTVASAIWISGGRPPVAAAGGFPVVDRYNTANADTAVNTLAVNKPTSSNDDLLLLICTSAATNGGNVFETTEPGADTWTYIDEWGNGTSDAHIAIFWRISDGTEASTATCDQTAGNDDEMRSWYLVISNVDTTTPINDGNVGNGTVVDASSVAIAEGTSTVDDTLGIYVATSDQFNTGSHSVTGTGWSETTEGGSGSASAGNFSSWGEKEVASIGGSGSPTVSLDGAGAPNGVVGVVILIAPL